MAVLSDTTFFLIRYATLHTKYPILKQFKNISIDFKNHTHLILIFIFPNEFIVYVLKILES